MRRAWKWIVLVVAVLLVVYGCGILPPQREAAFRENDPTGYLACSLFDEGLASGGDVSTDLLTRAASEGLDARSLAIRAAIDDREGGRDGVPFFTAGFDVMRDACKSEGYRFKFD